MHKIAEQRSRSGSGRRDHRSDKEMTLHGSSASPGNDGWINVVGGGQRRKDDLTKFGSLNRGKISDNINLAPGGKFRYLL